MLNLLEDFQFLVPNEIWILIFRHLSIGALRFAAVSQSFANEVVPKSITSLVTLFQLRNQGIRFKKLKIEDVNDLFIEKFKCIESLDLSSPFTHNITDNGIGKLKYLTDLTLRNNKSITDIGLKYLNNLFSLNISGNNIITSDGIKVLTSLQKLHIVDNENIDNGGIKELTNLTILYLGLNNKVNNDGIKNLTKLKLLNIHYN
jgi:hypothetical protein